jgi:RHS repeat-associated protein
MLIALSGSSSVTQAGSEQRQVIAIEAAMRACQERVAMVSAFDAMWPSHNGVDPGPYPEDGFYDEQLVDNKKAAALVRWLYYEMSGINNTFLAVAPKESLDWADYHQLQEYSAINESNYVQIFKELVPFINNVQVFERPVAINLSNRQYGQVLKGTIWWYSSTLPEAISFLEADFDELLPPTHPDSHLGAQTSSYELAWYGTTNVYLRKMLRLWHSGGADHWELFSWRHFGSAVVNTAGTSGTVQLFSTVKDSVKKYRALANFDARYQPAPGPDPDLLESTSSVPVAFGQIVSFPAGGTYTHPTAFGPTESEALEFPYDLLRSGEADYQRYVVHDRKWTFKAFVTANFKSRVSSPFRTITVTCPTCDTGCPMGSLRTDNACVDVSIDLGRNADRSAASLTLRSELPHSDLSSPVSLRLKGERGISIINAVDSSERSYFRQIITPSGLLDIIIDDEFAYHIDFYESDKIGAADPATGIRSLNGDSYQTISVSNTAGLTPLTELQVQRLVGGVEKETSTFTWDSALATWELERSADGEARITKRIPQASPGLGMRQEVIEVRDGDGNLLSKRRLTFQTFAWNTGPNAINSEELVEEVNDPDGVAHATRYEYYESTDATTGALAGRLKLITFANGAWEKTQYYNDGQTTYVTSPWENTAAGGAGPVKFVHRKVSPMDADFFTVEEGVDNAGVKKRTKLRFERYDEDQAVTYHSRNGQMANLYAEPTFSATSADNLKSITTYYNSWSLDGTFSGRIFRQVSPDGLGKVYSYRNTAEGLETTVYDGLLTTQYAAEAIPPEPVNGVFPVDADVMTLGTKSISVTNFSGQEIRRAVYDLESGEEVFFSEATGVDGFGRVTQRDFHDGTSEEFHYDCCGLRWSVDREGVRTDFDYDGFGQLKESSRAGITTKTSEEFVGGMLNIVTTRIGTDESSTEVERVVRDLAGRTVSQTAFGIRPTNYSEELQSTGETIKTTTYPGGGGTRIETYYRSGLLKSVTGTAVAPLSYEYGIAPPYPYGLPRYYIKTTRVGTNGEQTEWVKTHYDALGRRLFEVNPDFYPDGTTPTYVDYTYKSDTVEAKVTLTSDEEGYARMVEYDDLGRVYREIQDIDWDWDVQDEVDRIKRTSYSIATRTEGIKVRRTFTEIWTEDESPDPGKTVTVDVSLDGLTQWQSIKDLATQKELTTKKVTSYDRDNATRTETTTYPDQTSLVSTYINGRLQSNVRRNSSNVTVAQVGYEYDEHGRVEHVTDSAYGKTSYTYHDDDQIHETITPDPDPAAEKTGAGYDAQTTTMIYDDAGRLWKTTFPDDRVETRQYYPTGKLKLLYGGDNYPRKYVYDSQGRMKTLMTWQSFNSTTETGSGEAVTTWNYHPERGWLDSKVLPATTVTDSQGVETVASPTVSYEYTEAGRVKVKTGARGITTTYGYTDAGELSTLTYSDNTPGVTFTYNREGRIHTVTDSAGVLTRTYSLTGAVDDESYSGTGVLSGQAIVRTFDAEDRLDTISFGGGAYSVDWNYDAAGRVDTISQGGYTAAYSYRPNSVVIDGVTYKQGAVVRGSIERKQDAMGRVWRADTYAGATLISRRDYTFDQANRRSEALREDGRKWAYGYNGKSEVESAQLTQGSEDPSPNAPVPGFSFAYGYDDIGNRTTATTNGRQETYTVDLLNRFTERRGPVSQGNFVDVRGTADVDAAVLVNDALAARTGKDFYVAAPVNGPRAELKVQAVKTTPSTSVATESIGARVTDSDREFKHDLDGNLLNHIWDFEWDAENRLTAAETNSSGPEMVAGLPARRRIEYRYDAFGRCVERTVNQRNATNTGWESTQTTRYLYDGWNRVAELDGGSSNAVAQTFVWGLDVSGTPQGAGGIGGLLWVTLGSETHAAGYDGNSNVIQWIGLSTGASTGAADYDSFGQPLSRSGVARQILYGFSSKPTDPDTKLIYYGFRWYLSSFGRWLSLDPAEERGGVNLYAFVGNKPLNFVDILGLSEANASELYRNCCEKWRAAYKAAIKSYATHATEYLKYRHEEAMVRAAVGEYQLNAYDTSDLSPLFDATKALNEAKENIIEGLAPKGSDLAGIAKALGVADKAYTLIEAIYAYKEDGAMGAFAVGAAELRKALVKELIKQTGKTAAIDLSGVSSGVFIMVAATDLGYSIADIMTYKEKWIGSKVGRWQSAQRSMQFSIEDMVRAEKVWSMLDCSQFGKLDDE